MAMLTNIPDANMASLGHCELRYFSPNPKTKGNYFCLDLDENNVYH